MKNKPGLAAFSIIILLTSCGHHSPRVTSINTSDGTSSIKIKYSGTIKFSKDSTSIESISPYGYLTYQKNEKKLLAQSNEKGQLTLELINDGKNLVLNDTGKDFLAKAVKEMITMGVRSESSH
ncbi:MAG TPA: hypothetical protein VF476_09890 [Chitinophagaceae bacterium]